MSTYRHQVKLFYILNVVIFICHNFQHIGALPTHRGSHNDVIKPQYARLRSLVGDRLEAGFYEVFADDEPAEERPGNSNEANSCDRVRHVPNDVGIEGMYHFYKKYTEAYGIPVLGSEFVSNSALKRACYGIRFMFADDPEMRQAFYKGYGRLVVLSTGEKITALPEYRQILPKNFNSLNSIGGAPSVPVVVVSEQDLNCRAAEDILVKELTIGIMNIAMPRMERGQAFLRTLERHYHWAVGSSGLWSRTTASLSPQIYLGEGVQSYLSVNKYASPPDGRHNNIASRNALQSYDPMLFNLILEILPCGNSYQHDCREAEKYQVLEMNCPSQIWLPNI